MEERDEVKQEQVDKEYEKLDKEAKTAGYNLNPDLEVTKELVKGLITNDNRYGYQSCPCRLSTGRKYDDMDIICPCDYRDADLNEYDTCYCGLYVSSSVVQGWKKVNSIPERRPVAGKREKNISKPAPDFSSLPLPVFRCKVCGYLCAREDPPEICPICKANKERFERFI